MRNRLDRLRLNAVVGRNYENDDVGCAGAARAHCRKGFVAGRIEKGDVGARRRPYPVCADMLRDPAGLAADHIRLPERIEERGLAVVHMAHHSHDRRARAEIVVVVRRTGKPFLDVALRDAGHAMPELLNHEFGGIGIDRLRRGRPDAVLHQHANHVDGARGHPVGKFADQNGFGHNDFALDELLSLPRSLALAFAFAGSAHRRKGALPFLFDFFVERLHDGELAGAPARLGAALLRGGPLVVAPPSAAIIFVPSAGAPSARQVNGWNRGLGRSRRRPGRRASAAGGHAAGLPVAPRRFGLARRVAAGLLGRAFLLFVLLAPRVDLFLLALLFGVGGLEFGKLACPLLGLEFFGVRRRGRWQCFGRRLGGNGRSG